MGNLSSFTNATVAPQIVATGTLAAGQTDFGTTLAFPVNQYPTQQVGAVLVYLDGQLLLRNVGNATASPSADGNYQEVDAGNGFSILIRLNQADPLNARTYTIVSNGFTVAQPTSVYQSQIQTLQTQQDVMASTLADVAGVSTTAFYAVPNDTTRLTFTNRVTALETNSASKNISNTWTANQQLPGLTTGAAVAAGYIGERITGSTFSPTLSGSRAVVATIAITPGVWLITVAAGATGGATTGTRTYAELALGSGGTPNLNAIFDSYTTPTVGADIRCVLSAVHNTAISATVYLNMICVTSAGTPVGSCLSAYAIRIA